VSNHRLYHGSGADLRRVTRPMHGEAVTRLHGLKLGQAPAGYGERPIDFRSESGYIERTNLDVPAR